MYKNITLIAIFLLCFSSGTRSNLSQGSMLQVCSSVLGPYSMVRSILSVTSSIFLPHCVCLSCILPETFDPVSPISFPVSNAEDVFEIKEILKAKLSRGKLFYFIYWNGFDPGNLLSILMRLSLFANSMFARLSGGGMVKEGGTVTSWKTVCAQGHCDVHLNICRSMRFFAFNFWPFRKAACVGSVKSADP